MNLNESLNDFDPTINNCNKSYLTQNKNIKQINTYKL